MTRYSKEPRTRKYIKGHEFLSFERKYSKQLLDTGLDALKTASKKVVHKAAEATDEFIRNKIEDTVGKLNKDKTLKTNPVEEIIIPPEKREEILNKLKQKL